MPGPALRLLPPEARVILLSAGGDHLDAELRRLLRQELNWHRLCGLAEREHASAVLWPRIARLGCDLGAGSALLQRLSMISEFKLRRLQQRLYETTDALTAAGIEVILLKGAAVAHTSYSQFSHRPMGDIDLLVSPEQAAAATAVIEATGWMQSPDAAPDRAYEGHQHLPPFIDTGSSGARLDLHTNLFFEGHPFGFSAHAVRSQAHAIIVKQRALLVPDPLHQLLYACLHFAYSHMMGLGAWRTFRDIAAMVDTGVDWKEFVSLARASAGESGSYWTLRLARSAAGVPVPDHVVQDLSPALSPSTLRFLERHFTLGLLPTGASCPSVRLRNLLWKTGLFASWNKKGPVRPWSRLRRLAVPSADGHAGWVSRMSRHFGHAMASPRYVWDVLRG